MTPSRLPENVTLWTLLEDSIRTSLGRFSETVKHSTSNFLVFSFNTFDEVTLAKYDSNPFYTDVLGTS